MGALKLTYYETKNPLKVVYSKTLEEQKSVQRFLSVDPMSELDFHLSPYNYVGNNPLNFVDPTGMKRVNIEGSRNYYDDETWELTVVGDKPHSDPVFGNMYVNYAQNYQRTGHASPYDKHFQAGGRDAAMIVGAPLLAMAAAEAGVGTMLAQGASYFTILR